MTDLALTVANIAVVFQDRSEIYQRTLAEAVTAGQPLFQDTDGKLQLADANASGEQQVRFLSLEAGAAEDVISCLRRGHVRGFTLSSQAYDIPIYLSDTVGVLADSVGSMTVPVGIVDSVNLGGTFEKLLYFNARWRGDYS